MTPREEVAHWITEREKARINRDKGCVPPLCNDEIINTYRFCNVRRQDDKVTRWLLRNWYSHHKNPDFVAWMLLARMVNWPPTLKRIQRAVNWQWDNVLITTEIQAAQAEGKAWTSAYVITTCGAQMDKAVYVVQTVCSAARLPTYRPAPGDTLDSFWTKLRTIPGLGAGFIAAQVVADLKYTPLLVKASDWHTWAVPGPGSRRGINRYYGWPITTRLHKIDWQERLAQMINEVQPLLPDGFTLHAQDWQNVMCEYDKWKRVKHGEGRPRQRYTPSDAYSV